MLLGMVTMFMWWRVDVADMKGDLETLKANDEKQEQRWETQLGLNGSYNTLTEFILGRTGAAEEEDQEEGP